jgi:ZIP family zinc transporter
VDVLEGAFWGFVGGAALILGAVIAQVHEMSKATVARIMAFGAGVLISALTFDLTAEAFQVGGTAPTAAGLLLGGAVFVAGDGVIGRREMRARAREGQDMTEEMASNPQLLALGAILDGIPESFVIGASVTHGEGVSVAVVVAVFLSNLPESLSAAAGFRRLGWTPRRSIRLWVLVTIVATLSAALGALVADNLKDNWFAFVNSFAAGAVLAMIADTMIPDAFRDAGRWAGFITVAGFALAFLISTAS